MQVQQLAHQPEAAAEETVFSESLSYISATSTASHCIFVFHISTICTAAEETVFSSSCIVDCTFGWRANQTPLSQSNHFPGFVFHFCIQALQHHLGNELWFLDKASTFELVCKWKWSNEIKVWKIDMSNFSHATLLDLSQYPTDIRRIPLQLNMKLWAVSEWQKNFPFYKCSN